MNTMKRVAFKMRLFKGQEAEYKKRHDQLWPELESLLHETGIREYSIFLDEADNSPVTVPLKEVFYMP